MAIYHCSVKNISRSGGKSAVASASYRAGEKLEDRETGLTHDYTHKTEVAYSEIILCENAPREYQDRETLWNAVEEVEKQSNARLAREWEVALPHELTLEHSKELVRGYAQSLADEGMCVDVNIHWKEGNHHAHIMGTTRPIKENGEWGQKEKKAYKLDENGQKIPQIDPKTGQQKVRVRKGKGEEKLWERETVEANDWNKTEKVEEWRERWAEHCNRYLEKEQQIDHRSFERQGIERIPTIHEGYVARQMEEKGQTAERCEINRDINAANTFIQSLNQRIEQIKEKAREILNGAITKLRADYGSFRDSRTDTSRERIDETRSRARQQVNKLSHGGAEQYQVRADEVQNVGNKIRERERETALRTQSVERREPTIARYDSSLSETDRRINKLNNGVEQAREKIAREEKVNERLQRLRTARATDEPVGRNADGNRPVQADHSRPAERSVEERLSALRSARASGNPEQREQLTQQPVGTGETVGELLRSISAERSNQRAEERQSAEVRDDKVSQRENRDALRERQRAEAERRAKAEEQRIAKERAERKARSQSHGLSR